MNLREATAADFLAIARLYETGRAIEVGPDPEQYRYLRRMPDGATLLVELRGRTVGFATFDGAMIKYLYVDPAHLREGVGAALLGACCERIAGEALVQVYADNAPARALYEKLGFALRSTQGSVCTYSRTPTRPSKARLR